jgi:predicted DNA-binding transcriptional regulator AlpA
MSNVDRRVLRPLDAATYLGLAAGTLAKMRVRGQGPRFIRLGSRLVGYDLHDLDEWIEQVRRKSEPA